jgi:RNA polymerase sigma factor (sigma-70 family)
VDSLLARAEHHFRGRPEWAAGEVGLARLRAEAREWLFRRLFDPHLPELTRRVRAMFPHLSSPDAVVSQAWARVKAWWVRDVREPVSNPMGLLMNAAVFASKDGSRRGGGPLAYEPAEFDGGFDPSDTGTRPDEAAERNDLLQKLLTLTGRLTADQRRLLSLRFEQGLNFDKIGRVLGIQGDTARKQLSRLIDDLRAQLVPSHGKERS